MKHTYAALLYPLLIRPLEHKDIEFLRELRNSKQLSKYLKKINYISPDMQEKWFQGYLNECNHYCWGISLAQKLIGSLALYNVKGSVAEIGKIMIEPAYQGKGFAYSSFLMALTIGFKFLNISSFYLSVHEQNMPAQKAYEKLGFKITGSHPFDKNGNELELELDNSYFWKENTMIENIKLFSNYTGAGI